MPLEVSPVPFPNQQLPGFPKFSPPYIEGLTTEGSSPGSGHGYAPSGPGGLRGPESAAANTIISPIPGGVAGPHRAIPALPEAGYTSPTMAMGGPVASSLGGGGRTRPRTIGIGGFGAAPSAVGMMKETGSVYAGGSLYGGHSGAPSGGLQLHGMDGPVGASGGWAGGSLPAPRHMLHVGSPPKGQTVQFQRARRGSLDEGYQVSHRENEHHQHREHDHSSHHEHSHHHQYGQAFPEREHEHHHHLHRDRRDSVVDDDGITDVSYYARPRARRRSRSISSTSEVSGTPREASRRRTTSMQPRSPSRLAVPRLRSPSRTSGHHDHSPLSPSPLTRSPRGADSDSERGRIRHEDREELDHRMENLDIDDRRGRSRHKRRSRLPEREGRQSESDSDAVEPSRYPSRHADHFHHHGEKGSRRRRHSDAEHHHDLWTRMQSRARVDNEHSPRSPPREQESEPRHVRGHSHRESEPDGSRDYHTSRDQSQHRPHMHHRHKSASHVDEPLPRAPPSISPSEAISQAHHRQHEGPPRPRAQSSYQLRDPPAGLMNPYLGQSELGLEPGTLYDDGGSVAGTALTFMDGAVGGRVSQYGLPKYPHQPKMDYRRFMVQRGKADVFMD